ncbi:MAG: hypothetical protein B6226_05555 [Candidatus Cloacimonetes bacterium 4572_65]|nr:MAG: hypothetical protein B6226_05555 [Candidatus Cloacimonetes bacterium 4572_65]
MTDLSIKIIDIIKAIPHGKVLTYGEVAFRAGSPRAARQVSHILHSLSEKYQLPWHRVINSQGKISLKGFAGEEQFHLLAAENIKIVNGKIDLDIYMG